MTNQDKLIKQLESLEFKYKEYKRGFEYTKLYNNHFYTISFYYKNTNYENQIGIRVLFEFAPKMWSVKISGFKHIDETLKYLNEEFKYGLRKQKIKNLL